MRRLGSCAGGTSLRRWEGGRRLFSSWRASTSGALSGTRLVAGCPPKWLLVAVLSV